MTTHVSRERREAVIDALILHHDVSEDGDISFAAMADAALSACLPDRAAFERAVERCIQAGEKYGDNSRMSYAREIADTKAALIALIYGADDAQAGDQEGAEHE